MKYHVLYNPLSGVGDDERKIESIENLLGKDNVLIYDILDIKDYNVFFSSIGYEDGIVLFGGDGTLNRFVNSVRGIDYKNRIYVYAGGTGNDFLRDIGQNGKNEIVCVDEYIRNLPEVTVNGKTYLFVNNVGFGVDGYCCEVGDRIRAKSKKRVNYAAIAFKGFMYAFKPVHADVIVDGHDYHFDNTWIAASMNGRYYGGGIKAAPDQDRMGNKGVTLFLIRSNRKIYTLLRFASAINGNHVKYKDVVMLEQGRNITVKFDRPAPLQIDGETFLNITEYSVKV